MRANESAIKTYDAAEARRTILRRARWEDQEMPASVLDSIERVFRERISPAAAVERILRDVRRRGDAALRDWSARIDGFSTADGESFDVPQAEWQYAYERLQAVDRAALDVAAGRIASFHRQQPTGSWMEPGPDGILGQIVRPLERVGVYVPGGTAPLPSSLLMAAIPARVAGVEQVVACTPRGRDGRIADLTLAAAWCARIDQLYALSGAQAIAAMAYGSESIRPVDKIVGAGGLFTTLAKRQVIGTVGIDGIYGPTETLLIADNSARPAWVAADLLAQAEHDVLASALLLTPSRPLADAVIQEVDRQLETLTREQTIRTSLRARGGIVLADSIEECIDLANDYAPEHLCLLTRSPWDWVGKIRNAGGIFVGDYSFEVLGDYVAGPSHVMPTEGSARFASPLSVADFVKRINLVAVNREAGERLSGIAATLAEGEGLTAHAAAARCRPSRP